MNIKNYDEATELVQNHLVDYLIDMGVISSREQKFKCLNPNHKDEHPSMSVAPSGKVVHCFSCLFSMNIFQVCHYLENKPISGADWVTDNLKYLADKYNVPLEVKPLTEEQIYEFDTRKAYKAAADLILGSRPTAAFSKAITERGWTPEICREFGIGCIPDFKKFREDLKSLGFSPKFQDDIDLNRPDIFNDNKLIFTIRDEVGNPVGFSSRNLDYTDDKKNGSKYVNQRTTGIKVNIYKKSSRLYGFDRVLVNTDKRTKSLYVFEGYPDVVTAVANGLTNCVGIGGVHLTVEQLQLMKEYGYYVLYICLDGDAAGKKTVAWNLDNVLSGHKDLKVKVIVIPEEKDPDQFIRENTISKFKNLTKWDAFEWRLTQFTEEDEVEEICKSMIPLIVNETSYISQEKMCEQLSKHTGVEVKIIRNELTRLQNIKEAEKAKERDLIIESMFRQYKKDPLSAEQELYIAQNKLYELARKYDEDSFSEDTCLSVVQTLKESEESKDGSFSGFKLGEDLENLEKALCGEWKKDVWFLIAGRANSGKTSLMCKLIYSIANEKENDACVIYHSIDDTIQQVLPKFICVAENSKKLTLNEVIDPNYYKKTLSEFQAEEMLNRRETGYEAVKKLIKSGRIIIKDANSGCTLSYADSLIKYYRQKFPKRNIVYVLDNFHKLQGSSAKDERTKFKDLSMNIKALATKYHILVISTVEYRKIQGNAKAGNQDLAESGQLEYDGNLVAHVHNELHEKKGQAVHIHRELVNGKEVRLPRIEFEISKNKITAFKESLWFDFWPASSDFQCVSNEKVAFDARSEKKDIEASMSDKKTEYFEWVQEAAEKGWNPKAPNAKYRDKYGEWPPASWQSEANKLIETKH